MDKLLAFGKKALFYARVLSGYEERRIRGFRLQLEKRVQQVLPLGVLMKLFYLNLDWMKAQERKAALRRIPEQAVLAEVRRMVEEMQTLNKKLDETEAAIEEYFKPIDKEAEILMKMQLEGEEKTAREMMRTLQQQALLEKVEAEKISTLHQADAKHHKQDQTQTSFETPSQAQMR
ncbi:hypothetical protein CJ030_MR3G007095 [Morella rubra]|uniref:Uncharacterized protein n=1 Tax=Morella rubra TaxID=262757 RepID=A0A6A1W493_9ROSI|nr:hypothetical protein CJ030_MR3G007095 [Morella rubra]